MSAKKTQRDPDDGEKIVFLGATNVGKSSLVYRLEKDYFPRPFGGRGATFAVHKITIDGRTVKLELWDTAGQERFRSFILSPLYYKWSFGCHSCL